MINSIHHIAILISSEQTLEFYKLLGFNEILRKARANDTVVLLEGLGIQLEVFIDDRHPARIMDLTEPLGTRHFALKVDDIEAEIVRLKSLMMEQMDYDPQLEEIGSDWMGERYGFFKNPDGNVIELHE